MKRIPIFIFIIAIVLSVAATMSGCKERANDKATMYVSIAPLKYLVEAIVGDDFAVEVLVPAGASPETFEPTPKQFIALNESVLVFSTGLLDFENNLLSKVHNSERITDLSHGIETIAGSCSHHHHGHHCSHGIDPHVWCSPKELMIMAENAYHAIECALPDSLVKYEPRYTALCQELLDLDEEVAEMCRCSRNDYFIIYHPALTYLARDYGLRQVAIEHEGKEAGAKRLSEIIASARRDGVRRVLYQSEFPRSSVEVICEDIDAEPLEINPLAEGITEEIRRITALITE